MKHISRRGFLAMAGVGLSEVLRRQPFSLQEGQLYWKKIPLKNGMIRYQAIFPVGK